MKIYQASQLQAFLQELGVDARKGLSQNFLIDGNILRKIAATAEIQPGDRVLEIGPGPGALTELLLEKGAHVTAFEIDPVFARALPRLQTETPRLEVIEVDFLEFELEKFLDEKKQKSVKWKVVANLPYHITTPILTRLLPLHAFLDTVTLLVQKEYAQRIVALPRTSEYGSLSLFARFYSDPTYCFTVKPTCFYPSPKVHSALLSCRLHPPPTISSVDRFFLLTRTAFHHRRKMLRSSLKELYPSETMTQALSTLGLNPQARPEELSLEQFLLLFERLDLL